MMLCRSVKRGVLTIVLGALCAAVSACIGQTSSVPATGSEAGRCHDNRTCDDGLVCSLSNICVRVAGDNDWRAGDPAEGAGDWESWGDPGGDTYWPAGDPQSAGDSVSRGDTYQPTGDCCAQSGVPDVYLPATDLQFIHWSVPVRAYPGIDLDFKMTGYDWFNRTLVWSIVTGPAGMSIDSSTGVISWTPSPPQTGDHSVTVRMTPQGGVPIDRSFTINVNTNDFVFVATTPTGNDSTGDGSITLPYATIDKACEATSVGDGKTILIRDGTYYETFDWQTAGGGPLRNKSFTEADYTLIAAYPGETVVIDCQLLSGGLMLNYNQQYVGFDKLEVRNASQIDGAGLGLQSINTFAKRCIVHGSDWDYHGNCNGILHIAGTLLDSCESYDNQSTLGAGVNSSNFLYYADKGEVGAGDAFAIDCVSSGGSIIGFKIKHAGSFGQIHYHRCVSYDSRHTFMGGSNYSSIRHSISVPWTDGSGILIGINATDDNQDLGMLWQSNLLTIDYSLSYQDAAAFNRGSMGFLHTTIPNTGVLLRDNQIVSVRGGTYNGDGSPIATGIWNSLTDIQDIDFSIVANRIYSPSDSNLMEFSQNNMLDLSGINSISSNSGNIHSTVPATIDKEAAGGTWRWDRDANTLTQIH